jgi:peptidoglycan/LPS O-acetylase OafA/YrhL
VERRNPFIDLLRGLSILAVMLMHFGFSEAAGTPGPLKLVLANAYYGVTVFFVISGYLIATTSIRRFGSLPQINPAQFAAFRVGRIAPLLLLVLALLLSLSLRYAAGFAFSPRSSALTATAGVLSLQFNDWYIHHRHDPHAQAWTVIWSLSIEEIFYLVFPIACRVLRSQALIVGWLLLALPVAFYARTNDGDALYAFTGCVDALAIGVLTSLLAERARGDARPVLATLGMLGALGAIVCVAKVKTPWVNPQWGPPACALAAGLFILSSTRFPASPRRDPRGALRVGDWVAGLPLLLLGALGQASYEAYLLHMPVQRFVTNYLWAGANKGVLLVLIGVGSFLINRCFTEPMNRLVRNRLVFGRQQSEHHQRLPPLLVAVALMAVPNIIMTGDRRHPSAVVSASVTIHRAALGGGMIPLVAYGEWGDADFVSISKRDDGTVQLQYDHWGSHSVVKAVPPDLATDDFTVTLDCRVPAILVEGRPVLGQSDLVGFSAHDAITLGKNDIGGTTMALAAKAEVEGSTLMFDNGTMSHARAWMRGE